jgi:Cu-processing system ATP-binding protein
MVRVERLSKRFGDVLAVDDVSFEVEPGETFAVIGPNGAGKTTTLKILLGLTRPDAGRVALGPDALPPADARARAGLGYVPQRVEFPHGRTVRDVLEFFASLRGAPREAIGRALDRVGLTALATRRASELSGGYTQRLSLAQALLDDPSLLVLDEPTASLDPEATWEFRTLVEQLREEGKTILLCSHLLAEVERIADRVLILVGGRRAALERVSDLRLRQVQATRLLIRLAADAPGADAAGSALAKRGIAMAQVGERSISVEGANGHAQDALEALRAAGVAVHSFEMQRPTLEDVFLQVVHGERRS